MTNCPNCNAPLNGEKFCPNCGTRVNEPQPTYHDPYAQPQQPQDPYAQNPYNQPQQPQNPYNQPQQPQNPQDPFAYPPQAPYEYREQQQQKNNKATTALVCGIISLFCFGFILGIIAIVNGVQAQNELKKTNSSSGAAIAGIVLGIIGLVGWAIAIFFLPSSLEDLLESVSCISGLF